ncbi:protein STRICTOSIDINE SYNTHASE-LIKE 7-like isoform X1 [Gastrolobium bilobum]|uniref:protein STRICTOSIDINE SYNTHASE-LIKE 7-like isoform X1 n=1 Tax=Gastrolobium bilobum TaxID=150636 RepID=UPI002AB05380|nr:protein STRICTOSIDINE SYNTHASE-LIKE 7-like isoform X1 [Gastrolobium bilobum]
MSDSGSPHDFESTNTTTSRRSWLLTPFFAIVLPVAVAALLYRLDPFEPVQLPVDELSRVSFSAPARNEHMQRGSEAVAEGHVAGPEDLAYDSAARVIYTGCEDGWIKRVALNESSVADSVVEDWVNTGGRPLGLSFDQHGALIVADADKGLLRVTREKEVEMLVDEVEGLKFKLTDGVDVAHDGTIYFTDASYKYSIKEALLDILEGKPNGRFLSYNPATKNTTLLARDLYFPNGVAVSPDQHFVVFCETVLMKCKKYYIQGSKKGSIEKFCDLPGMPDNIHYDGQGKYWIGIATAFTPDLDFIIRYPFIRKAIAMVTKYVVSLPLSKNGGVIAVDLEGKPTAHYYDPELSLTSGIKIGKHIYCGSIYYPFVIRLDIEQYPALPTI